jgi:hypothetical protein
VRRAAGSVGISRILIALVGASLASTASCRHEAAKAPERAPVAEPPVARESVATSADTTDTLEAAGEVVVDSSSRPAVEKWISDPNVISLLSLMNARLIAAANVELENWHLENVREFAMLMARDHLALQRSIDSLIERVNIAPIRPALAGPIGAHFQAQLDSMLRRGSGPRGALDRAFVDQQVASHALMADYITQLAAVAENPALRDLLSIAARQVAADLRQARAMQTRMAATDSLAADSVARRGRRK